VLISGCSDLIGEPSNATNTLKPTVTLEPTATPEPTSTFTPTSVPIPTPSPTATALFSQSEAISRLRAYFELRFSETDKKFEQLIKQKASGDEMLVGSPYYDASVVQVATEFTSEWEEWRSRAISTMIAQYERDRVWLITLTNVKTYLYTGVGGSPPYITYEEQWWLFEQPGSPPIRNF